jgi:hypothetical protein
MRIEPLRLAAGGVVSLAAGSSLPETSVSVVNGAGVKITRALIGGTRQTLRVVRIILRSQRNWPMLGEIRKCVAVTAAAARQCTVCAHVFFNCTNLPRTFLVTYRHRRFTSLGLLLAMVGTVQVLQLEVRALEQKLWTLQQVWKMMQMLVQVQLVQATTQPLPASGDVASGASVVLETLQTLVLMQWKLIRKMTLRPAAAAAVASAL